MPLTAVSRMFHAGRSEAAEQRTPDTYWARPAEQVLQHLQASPAGLSNAAAAERLRTVGPNQLHEELALSRISVLARQLASPLLLLLLLLLFAAGISLLTGEWAQAIVVLSIVIASAAIGYRREYRAHAAAARLRSRVRTRTKVLREGRER